MENIYLKTLFAVFALCFFGCGDNGFRNLEPYYFPLKNLAEGQVYEYHSVGNPNDPPMYWYYRTVVQGGQTHLVGMAYDPEFEPDQLVREERVANGMLLSDFYTYETDSTGQKKQVRANIEANNVFSFRANEEKPGVLLTSLNWQTLADGANITLVRNRQFNGDTTFVFQGKKTPAIRMSTVELVEHTTEGTLPLEFPGEEWYAKGIGLVYLKKDINAQWQMAYELADIYPMKAFEEKFRVSLEE